MHVVREHEAPRYEAPGHHAMLMRRLQGREAGPAEALWIGLSTLEPGGGTTLDVSPFEKFYVVLEGRVRMTGHLDGTERSETLQPFDSCRFAPGEARQLHNPGPQPARVLLVMPNHPPQTPPGTRPT